MSASTRLNDLFRLEREFPEGKFARLVKKAHMDYPSTAKNRGTFNYLLDLLEDECLMPKHIRWGVEYTGKDGDRVLVFVQSEEAALETKAELRKHRRSPLIKKWYETDKKGVVYDERDRELL